MIGKVTEVWLAGIVTVAGTVASVVSLEERLTTRALAVAVARVTVPVEAGFAAYFRFVHEHRSAYRLLFGGGSRRDAEFADSVRRVEEHLARSIAELIEADIDPDHRRTLAYGLVGIAETTSRLWVAEDLDHDPDVLARQVADLAWAGLRGIHRIEG